MKLCDAEFAVVFWHHRTRPSIEGAALPFVSAATLAQRTPTTLTLYVHDLMQSIDIAADDEKDGMWGALVPDMGMATVTRPGTDVWRSYVDHYAEYIETQRANAAAFVETGTTIFVVSSPEPNTIHVDQGCVIDRDPTCAMVAVEGRTDRIRLDHSAYDTERRVWNLPNGARATKRGTALYDEVVKPVQLASAHVATAKLAEVLPADMRESTIDEAIDGLNNAIARLNELRHRKA